MGEIINMFEEEKSEDFPLEIVMHDQDGNATKVLVLDMFELEYEGVNRTYAILLNEEEEEANNNLVITRYETIDDTEARFTIIDNDDEFNTVVKYVESNMETTNE